MYLIPRNFFVFIHFCLSFCIGQGLKLTISDYKPFPEKIFSLGIEPTQLEWSLVNKFLLLDENRTDLISLDHYGNLSLTSGFSNPNSRFGELIWMCVAHNGIRRIELIENEIIFLDYRLNPIQTFSLEHIMPLIEDGHDHFGENKVQEAFAKWHQIKKEKKNLRLHMVGKLQSNKAKKAVEIFDYIHSLESQKPADILSKCQSEINKSINYFIQVNIGNESQKAGIQYNEVDQFYNYCTREKKMNIIGLMAIPPNDENTEKYFKSLSELNSSLGLKELSMGMSSDYMQAINYKATYLRIGSAIFGERS